jgi:hypothetical protein
MIDKISEDTSASSTRWKRGGETSDRLENADLSYDYLLILM